MRQQIRQLLNNMTLIAAGVTISGCRCIAPAPDALARIGTRTVRSADVETFAMVTNFMADFHDPSTLLGRDPVDALILVQAISNYGRKQVGPAKTVESGATWQWRKEGLLSAVYSRKILRRNFGRSDQELYDYYQKNPQRFSDVQLHDSGGIVCTTVTLIPFDSIREKVAQQLFLESISKEDGAPDLLHPAVLRHFKESGYRDYFIKRYYAEKTGTPLPDSLDMLVHSDGILDSNDIALFRSWFLDDTYWSGDDLRPFIIMGLRFRLFGEKAIERGFAERDDVNYLLDWALRFEIARHVIVSELLPHARKHAILDTSMLELAWYDGLDEDTDAIDQAHLAAFRCSLETESVFRTLDILLDSIRNSAGVVFLQSEWIDRKGGTPSSLLHEADSLRDAGNIYSAEELYTLLCTRYQGSAEAMVALVELARLQTEEEQFIQAISNYRRFLLFSNDYERKPEMLFSIGHLYDRSLNQFDKAYLNYRWILRHAPQSAIASSAEVMLLHLGEPMPGIDYLRAEALRQGRDVPEQ